MARTVAPLTKGVTLIDILPDVIIDLARGCTWRCSCDVSAPMNNAGLKAGVAQVLVEGIFRRAGYQTMRARRRDDRPSPTRDLYVWKPIADDGGVPAIHRLARVAVEYSDDVERAVRDEAAHVSADRADMYLLFVTDRPAPGRACFQVVPPAERAAPPWATVDLDEADDLDFLRSTVEEYDRLVRVTFPVLSGDRRGGARAGRQDVRPIAVV